MTRFQPSSSSSAAVSAERRLTLVRSMGMAARANDHSGGLPGPVEEVVGGRRHHRAVAELARGRVVSSSGVSTWLAWLAAKMTGASTSAQVLHAPHGGRGRRPGPAGG